LPRAVAELVVPRVSPIVLADIGKLVAGTQEELGSWLKSGGVLIRFAGPRLEQGGDELLPVALRRGGPPLGGSVSWRKPHPLAPSRVAAPPSAAHCRGPPRNRSRRSTIKVRSVA